MPSRDYERATFHGLTFHLAHLRHCLPPTNRLLVTYGAGATHTPYTTVNRHPGRTTGLMNTARRPVTATGHYSVSPLRTVACV